MKIKLIIALLFFIVGNALVPNFQSTTLSATFVNANGEPESCSFNWGGLGYGKSLSDGKFEECIRDKEKNGYSLTSNETIVKDQTLIKWLLFE